MLNLNVTETFTYNTIFGLLLLVVLGMITVLRVCVDAVDN
jgi:hypothetical protein